jgi:phospholipase C
VEEGAPSTGAAQLEHVILLVLENRSFDHLLGYLNHPSDEFDGLANRSDLGNYLNPRNSSSPWYPPQRAHEFLLPGDPDHEHNAVLGQIKRVGSVVNAGFVHSYVDKALRAAGHEDRRRFLHTWSRRLVIASVVATLFLVVAQVWWGALVGLIVAGLGVAVGAMTRGMRVTGAEQDEANRRAPFVMRAVESDVVPVLSTLAREFGLCQRWFCSVPGETWPNRNFFHAGTSSGSVNIELGLYRDRTIFQILDEAHRSWKVYYGQFPPEVFCYPYVLERSVECSGRLQDLFHDLDRGTLPTYAFVEPHQGLLGKRPSCSQHPGNNLLDKDDGSDFQAAERLIGEIYQRLRENSELFSKTLFVIAYDEHGGLYDHRRPPLATAVKARNDTWTRRVIRWLSARNFSFRFGFRRLGPRIPCVVVSPWIPAHTIDTRIRDHTSIPRTLRKLFAPHSRALSRREAKAWSVDSLLTRSAPRTKTELPDLGPVGPAPLFEDEHADAAPELPRSEFEWRLLHLTDSIKLGTIDRPRRRIWRPARGKRRPAAVRPLDQPKQRHVGPVRRRQLRKMKPDQLVEFYDTTEFYLGALTAERRSRAH